MYLATRRHRLCLKGKRRRTPLVASATALGTPGPPWKDHLKVIDKIRGILLVTAVD